MGVMDAQNHKPEGITRGLHNVAKGQLAALHLGKIRENVCARYLLAHDSYVRFGSVESRKPIADRCTLLSHVCPRLAQSL